jgi:hypothetical protein
MIATAPVSSPRQDLIQLEQKASELIQKGNRLVACRRTSPSPDLVGISDAIDRVQRLYLHPKLQGELLREFEAQIIEVTKRHVREWGAVLRRCEGFFDCVRSCLSELPEGNHRTQLRAILKNERWLQADLNDYRLKFRDGLDLYIFPDALLALHKLKFLLNRMSTSPEFGNDGNLKDPVAVSLEKGLRFLAAVSSGNVEFSDGKGVLGYYMKAHPVLKKNTRHVVNQLLGYCWSKIPGEYLQKTIYTGGKTFSQELVLSEKNLRGVVPEIEKLYLLTADVLDCLGHHFAAEFIGTQYRLTESEAGKSRRKVRILNEYSNAEYLNTERFFRNKRNSIPTFLRSTNPDVLFVGLRLKGLDRIWGKVIEEVFGEDLGLRKDRLKGANKVGDVLGAEVVVRNTEARDRVWAKLQGPDGTGMYFAEDVRRRLFRDRVLNRQRFRDQDFQKLTIIPGTLRRYGESGDAKKSSGYVDFKLTARFGGFPIEIKILTEADYRNQQKPVDYFCGRTRKMVRMTEREAYERKREDLLDILCDLTPEVSFARNVLREVASGNLWGLPEPSSHPTSHMTKVIEVEEGHTHQNLLPRDSNGALLRYSEGPCTLLIMPD